MLVQPNPAQFARPHAQVLDTSKPATLHVCTMISNPLRFQSRYKLHEGFQAQNNGAHVEMWTVEVAYGHRPFVVTQAANPRHLQLRTTHELWHKENAINLLFAKVLEEFPDAEYFAWVDADVTFARPDWAYETLQQLQHYHVVQMFSHAQDVGPKYEPLSKKLQGFMFAYCNDPTFMHTPARYGYDAGSHPGYAWAARRTALDTFGGLLDFAIVGGADRHMACGLIGTIEDSGPFAEALLTDLQPSFRGGLHIWQDRALTLNKNVGYVDGLLLHHWHGKKTDRKYGNRWHIYTDHTFDPWRDLYKDIQGLYVLRPQAIELRDALRSYMRARNEDSIDAG